MDLHLEIRRGGAGRDKWRLATNNDKPLDVIKKMKIGFFSLSVKLATCTVNGLRTDHLSCSLVQGVPTSLGYAKCKVLKLKKVCERSELCLQKDPIKRGKLVILMI